MKPSIPKMPVPSIRKQRLDPLIAMKINPHQFMPKDPATGFDDYETKRLHDWLDPSSTTAAPNQEDIGLRQAVKLKDERKRRVHLNSEHKRRLQLSDAINSAAVAVGMEGVPQMFVLQAVNETIVSLQNRKQDLAAELQKREHKSTM